MRKRFIAILMLLCLFLTGCSIDIKSLFVKDEEGPISNLSRDALLFDGKVVRTKTLELINSATESIYIEQRIFKDESIKNLIIDKAKSGVEVRILLDQFETPNRTVLNELKSHNISIQFYPAQKGQTNEAKFLIVDLKEALVFSHPWTENGFSAANFTIHLTGRSVHKLATAVFNRDWSFTTTLSLDIPKESPLPEDNIIVAKSPNVKNQLIAQVQNSKESIWAIVNNLTEPDTVEEFIGAATNGLDVRLILDPNVMPSNWPSTLQKLEESGVEIRYYKSDDNLPLGMNLAIFDGKNFIHTSSGWSYKSFVMNQELSLTVPSPTATEALIEVFDQYWQSGYLTPPEIGEG
ncbi:MAG: phosphatidylserine/phosphatidylglycerophosphate/cardiolipin synthase family protein [Desulfitobacterium sp.]|nr:phosphatidylserine/phosphatidylglycerophosphate/cardiolipin synthase family protein [Desulfitobacterium sp.]